MKHTKKISASLSVAATVLLEACSSSGSDSGLVLTANTSAPELIGSWQSACTITPAAAKQAVATFAQASGGGGSGSGGSPSGDAFIQTAVFNQEGLVILTTESFATLNCNANTSINTGRYEAAYTVGSATSAGDGSPAVEIDYKTPALTTFSIYQVVSGTDLYVGDITYSSPENDGSSVTARHDAFGVRLSKL